MKTSTVIWIVVAALVISGGLVTYLIFGTNTPIGTQVAPTQTPDDFDGDGEPNNTDYYPYDPTR